MNKKSILLVEDNPDDEKLILMSLEKHKIGNGVAVVRDGQEALDYLFCQGAHSGREGGLPTVVLLDLKLPKLDGLEVLKRIREDERTKVLPVVLLTSSDEQKDRLTSYLRGANSYVKKPLEFGEFTDAVKQLGLYWLVLNKPATD